MNEFSVFFSLNRNFFTSIILFNIQKKKTKEKSRQIQTIIVYFSVNTFRIDNLLEKRSTE